MDLYILVPSFGFIFNTLLTASCIRGSYSSIMWSTSVRFSFLVLKWALIFFFSWKGPWEPLVRWDISNPWGAGGMCMAREEPTGTWPPGWLRLALPELWMSRALGGPGPDPCQCDASPGLQPGPGSWPWGQQVCSQHRAAGLLEGDMVRPRGWETFALLALAPNQVHRLFENRTVLMKRSYQNKTKNFLRKNSEISGLVISHSTLVTMTTSIFC